MNISKLKADVEKLRGSVKRLGTKLQAQRAELQKLESALIDAEHKASIEKLVGVERGVIIGGAYSDARFRAKRVTVLKVNRTRADVRIGEAVFSVSLSLLKTDPKAVEMELILNGYRQEVEQ